MNELERKTMMLVAKELTEQGKTIKHLMNMMADNLQLASRPLLKIEPTPSPFHPEKVSVVDHEGTLNRFKMELKFEGGEMMAEQQRMDHSIRLLTEMEELLREYGVTKLTGTYERIAKPISA